MLVTLLRLEILKTRRSLALLMMLACPLMVVLLNTGLLLRQAGPAGLTPQAWSGFWMGTQALWCYFMLPLYLALCTALVNGAEHRQHGWRLMLTLPVGVRTLYLAKLLLAFGMAALAHLFLVAATLLAALLVALLPGALVPGGGAADAPLLAMAGAMLAALAASLPMLALQHTLSWSSQNLVLPLAAGVCATMGIVQLGSSQHWRLFPWSYPLMAANGSDPAMRADALVLALASGAALLLLGCWWAGRRPQPA